MPRPKRKRETAVARRQRKELSLPESLLWRQLKGQPGGVKFRRQHSIAPYLLDFFVAERRIAIEIDGHAHDTGNRPERDMARDAFLRAMGIETLRIPATDVLRSPEEVAEMLVRYCRSP